MIGILPEADAIRELAGDLNAVLTHLYGKATTCARCGLAIPAVLGVDLCEPCGGQLELDDQRNTKLELLRTIERTRRSSGRRCRCARCVQLGGDS